MTFASVGSKANPAFAQTGRRPFSHQRRSARTVRRVWKRPLRLRQLVTNLRIFLLQKCRNILARRAQSKLEPMEFGRPARFACHPGRWNERRGFQLRTQTPYPVQLLLSVGIAISLVPVAALAFPSSLRRLPEIEVQDQSGARFRFLPPQRGVVVMQTWASWCAPCHEALPFLVSLVRSAPEVHLVLLNVDRDRSLALRSLPSLGEVAQRATLLFDPTGQAPSRVGAPGMPSTFVIADGRVLLAQAGFDASLRARIEKAVRDALASQP